VNADAAQDVAMALVTARMTYMRIGGYNTFADELAVLLARGDSDEITAVVSHLANFIGVLCAMAEPMEDDNDDDNPFGTRMTDDMADYPLAVWQHFTAAWPQFAEVLRERDREDDE
jgi:hypothetical protein